MRFAVLMIVATTLAVAEVGCSSGHGEVVRPEGSPGLAAERRSAVESFNPRLTERAVGQEASAARRLKRESAGLHVLQPPPPRSIATEYRRSLSSSSPDVGSIDFGTAKDYYQADIVIDDLNGIERTVRPSVAVSSAPKFDSGSLSEASIVRDSTTDTWRVEIRLTAAAVALLAKEIDQGVNTRSTPAFDWARNLIPPGAPTTPMILGLVTDDYLYRRFSVHARLAAGTLDEPIVVADGLTQAAAEAIMRRLGF